MAIRIGARAQTRVASYGGAIRPRRSSVAQPFGAHQRSGVDGAVPCAAQRVEIREHGCAVASQKAQLARFAVESAEQIVGEGHHDG
jgi:hypothetical protein